MDLVTILPLAFVMVAGPQIISAVFLATSENWRRNSAALLAGCALAITLFVTIAYIVMKPSSPTRRPAIRRRPRCSSTAD